MNCVAPMGRQRPAGAIPSPEGKVPQCAHWGGRGMATGCGRNAVKVTWYNVETCTFLTICPCSRNISPSLFSHQNRFRRADFRDSFPPGEAFLRRYAALGGQRPPPLSKHLNNNFSHKEQQSRGASPGLLIIRLFLFLPPDRTEMLQTALRWVFPPCRQQTERRTWFHAPAGTAPPH